MSATAAQDSRVQPWKALWPPAKPESKSGVQYRADDSGALLVDGVCTHGTGETGELARSSKEAEAPKDARKNYMVDDSGSLLVDGLHISGGTGFCVLACSRKE